MQHGWLESAGLGLGACDGGASSEHGFPRQDRKIRGIESRSEDTGSSRLSARASAGCVLLAWNGQPSVMCACRTGCDWCERGKTARRSMYVRCRERLRLPGEACHGSRPCVWRRQCGVASITDRDAGRGLDCNEGCPGVARWKSANRGGEK